MAENLPNPPDRRDFLTAEPIRRWWQKSEPQRSSQSRFPLSENSQGTKPGFLLELNKSAMACQWDAFFNYGQYPDASEIMLEAFELIDQLEDRLSVFRLESEISRINHLAYQRDVEVSAELAELLEICFQLHKATAGAFDITSGPLSDLWGFARREGSIPNDEEIEKSLQTTGQQNIAWDEEKKSIRFLHPDTKFNFGGIGKGFALQMCSDHLLEHGISDFVIHGGQSSVIASGSKTTANNDPPDGWPVGLSDPIRPEKKLGHFQLRNAALGTSGSGRQFFHYKGKRFSHIFDPRTGRPAEGVLSSTVIAPDATIADALATSCFVLGPEGCKALCDQLPELAVLLVLPKGSSSKEIVKFGPIDQYWIPASTKPRN